MFRVVSKKKSRDFDDNYLNLSKKIVKVIVSIFLSLVILVMTMISKSTLFLITSNIYTNVTLECTWSSETEVTSCVRVPADRAKSGNFHPSQGVEVRWLWALYIVVCTPCTFTFFKCLWRMCFKKTRNPTIRVLLLVSNAYDFTSLIFISYIGNLIGRQHIVSGYQYYTREW